MSTEHIKDGARMYPQTHTHVDLHTHTRLVYLNIDGVNALPVDEFVFILMWRLNANLGSVYAAKNI